jgi:tetratricopeptide (TPR) repeat protein
MRPIIRHVRVAGPALVARAALIVLWVIVTTAACGPEASSYERLMAEGRAQVQRGEPGRALETFLRAQQSQPERKEPYVRIAGLCEALGLPEVGIPVLREAVALDDDNRGPYHFMLAVLLEAADDPRAAEGSYRSCIEMEPDFLPARANLGQLLFRSGRNREALELMAETTRRFPGDPVPRLQYAEMLLRDGSVDDAEALVRELLVSGDPPPQTHYLMGLIDLQRNRWEEARERLESAVQEEPEEMRAWYQLANACGRLGDRPCESRALAEFERLFRRDLGDGKGS